MDCSNDLIILPYEINMSWFIALLAVTLYSQRLRMVLLEANKRWNKTFPLFNIFSFLIHMKYTKSFTPADYEYFDTMTLENLLEELHHYDENKFWFDTDIINPMHAKYYIKNLYDFLDMSAIMISVYADEFVAFDPYNNITNIKESESIEGINIKTDILYPYEVAAELQKTPDILIIRLSDMTMDTCSEFKDHKFKLNYYLTNIKNITEILLHNEILEYNNNTYILDSVLLENVPKMHHTIAGMTCGNTKYVYNGWRLKKQGNDLIPCDLMEFDWDTNINEKFCLKTKQCGMEVISTSARNDNNYCYSFNKGERLLIYVKSQISTSKILDDVTLSPEYSLSKRFAPTGLLRIANKSPPSKSRSRQSKHKRTKSRIISSLQNLSPIQE